ncbi:disulfide bond formation protein DsbA [Spongiactinospora rosea]|uniref:Disulfide bond formation protein DsbA n=1 Tax=Spongiactinospora rosea TaxID=2248750 RepID=A0A366LMJ1_9ACTN|nr:disulfide bond formation protein DsbA [Spongiactinospora rosea]
MAQDADPPGVVLYFDPCCPYAWIASRWMLEVESQVEVDLRFRVMSLSLLNDEPPPDPESREPSGRLWVLARACAAADRLFGQQALRALYTALGRRLHNEGTKNMTVLAPALADAGLPADLSESAWSTDHDDFLRASHAEGMAPLGRPAGTPALHFDGQALFGPVLTGIPRGPQAVAVFNAVRTLAACPDWAEMKRDSTQELTFA